MRAMKKGLSAILVFALLLTFLPMGVVAADEVSVALRVYEYDAEKHEKTGAAFNSGSLVKAGSTVLIVVELLNRTNADMWLSAWDVRFEYDATLGLTGVESVWYGYDEEYNEKTYGYQEMNGYGYSEYGGEFHLLTESNEARLAYAVPSGQEIRLRAKEEDQPGSIEVGSFLVKISEYAPSGAVKMIVKDSDDLSNMVMNSAESEKIRYDMENTGLSFANDETAFVIEPSQVTPMELKGVSPETDSVTLPASGDDPATAQFHAIFDDVMDGSMDGTVTWSISDGTGGTPAGISIATNGKVTVTSEASPGNYTVTATPLSREIDTKKWSYGEAKTATLTVTRDETSTIALSSGNRNATLDPEEAASTVFLFPGSKYVEPGFTAKDAYGADIPLKSLSYKYKEAADETATTIDIRNYGKGSELDVFQVGESDYSGSYQLTYVFGDSEDMTLTRDVYVVYMRGDVNRDGRVDLFDEQAIANQKNGFGNLTPALSDPVFEKHTADVDGDGSFAADTDREALRQYDLGLGTIAQYVPIS